MISKLFEEVFWESNLCESKKHLHNFTVDREIPVNTGNDEEQAFLVIGSKVTSVWIITEGEKIRIVDNLVRDYKQPNGNDTNKRDWKKVVGYGIVQLSNGTTQKAEIHWYQCDNVGKREFKVKKWK